MAETEFVSFRVTPEHADRLTELGSYVGGRSRLIRLALAFADAAMTMTELIASGVPHADARVQAMRVELAEYHRALTEHINTKRRPDDSPDGAETLDGRPIQDQEVTSE